MSPFAVAIAAEFKGFMRATGVTGAQLAAALGRNAGYVSERANGKRAIDTNDIDALAALAGQGWTGRSLMAELARRARDEAAAVEAERERIIADVVAADHNGRATEHALAADEHTDDTQGEFEDGEPGDGV